MKVGTNTDMDRHLNYHHSDNEEFLPSSVTSNPARKQRGCLCSLSSCARVHLKFQRIPALGILSHCAKSHQNTRPYE